MLLNLKKSNFRLDIREELFAVRMLEQVSQRLPHPWKHSKSG